jgi:hypothetical protein
MSTMRDDEEFAKQRFDDYLHNKTSEAIQWKDGNQNVPPDFYLTIGAEEFVVEVTALTEQIELSAKSMPIRTLHGWCNDFVAEVKRKALEAGKLRGTYYVSFSIADKDVYSVRKPLMRKLLELIANTQEEDQVASTPVEVDGIKYCSVQKTPRAGDNVFVGLYPSTANWEIEALEGALQLLKNAVTSKAKRLQPFSQKKILLLLAEYPFVSSGVYRNFVDDVDLSQFHTVFIVDSLGTDRSYVLYTEHRAWA